MAGAEPNIYVDIANDLLAVAAQCLEDHTTLGAPAETILGHGNVPHWCCDYVMVYVEGIRPSTTFPATTNQAARECQTLEWVLDLVLKVRRCGYPKLEANPDAPFPGGQALSQATVPHLVDARVLACCIVAAWQNGDLFTNPNLPDLAPGLPEAKLPVVFGPFTPYREADCAGWDWRIQVGVTPCCELPPVASGS